MSRFPRLPHRANRYTLPIISIAFIVGVVVALIAITIISAPKLAGTPSSAPVLVPHFIDPSKLGTLRVVVIGAANEMLPGTSNMVGVLMANLREGHIPTSATTAIVLSDSSCAPDTNGISHCLNDLNIDGTVITVQHHHAMATVPCLSPGERVALMTLKQYQHQI